LNPISNGSPANGTGSGSEASPTSGELAVAEAQAQRRVLLRHEADALDDLAELLAADAQLVLVAVGDQLAVVRELAVDQARRQHGAADLEHDLVGAHADPDDVGADIGDDRAQLVQRAGRDVGLEARVERDLERGLLDAQAVGVGRDHPQLRP
jgi:hypothetical protein